MFNLFMFNIFNIFRCFFRMYQINQGINYTLYNRYNNCRIFDNHQNGRTNHLGSLSICHLTIPPYDLKPLRRVTRRILRRNARERRPNNILRRLQLLRLAILNSFSYGAPLKKGIRDYDKSGA